MKNDDFIGSQGEFAELCWEKNGGREMRKMIRLFNATPGERLGWIVGLRRHLSALKVNPGGQRCHVPEPWIINYVIQSVAIEVPVFPALLRTSAILGHFCTNNVRKSLIARRMMNC